MPRIYADVQEHTMDWGHVDFTEGVAAIPTTADTTYWTGASYAVDASKHALDVFDKMAKADLQELLTYLGVSFLAGDTKQALVRKAETFASTALITALTVASIAGTKSGDSKVTITGALGADGNTPGVQDRQSRSDAAVQGHPGRLHDLRVCRRHHADSGDRHQNHGGRAQRSWRDCGHRQR